MSVYKSHNTYMHMAVYLILVCIIIIYTICIAVLLQGEDVKRHAARQLMLHTKIPTQST